MKAIVYQRYGGPEVLEQAEVPTPVPGPGQVLIRVRAASVNAADYRMMRADPFLVRLANGLFRPRRQILGVDVAGEVEALGPGATAFALGEPVFGDTFLDGLGGFAEFVAVRRAALARKPDTLSFEEAAALPLAGVTALQAVRDSAAVREGEAVLIQGAGGGVGSMLVQMVKEWGGTVTAVSGAASVDLVRSLGADYVIDYSRDDFTARPERYDVIFGVNGYHPIGTYQRCLKPRGRYVMIGGTNSQLFGALLQGGVRSLLSGKKLGALTVDPRRRQEDLQQLRSLVTKGALRPIIERTFAFEETAEAIRYLERGHVRGKVVLRFDGAGAPRR